MKSPVALPPASPPGRRGPRGGALGRWAGRSVAILAGLLVPLLLLEVVLRLFGPILPGNYDTGAYLVRDETLGHFHVRGFHGWIKAPEFTTEVQISPLGLRDRRQSYAKPPGTFRVLLLGDSFLEAVQVQQWQGVAERLEVLLNQDSPRPVEVINGGVAAYGTGQELLLLDQVGAQFQPDLVVLLFFVGNDLTNNNYRLELWDGDLKLRLKPYFDLEGNSQELKYIPGPPPVPRNGFAETMRRSSVLYNVVETGVYNKLQLSYPREQLEAIGGLRTPLTGLYDTQPPDEWARAWRISEALLGRIRDRSTQLGAPLVVAGIPEWRVLDPAAWEDEIRKSNPRSNRLDSGRLKIGAPIDNLAEVVSRVGVPFIDLQPPIEAAGRDGTRLYYDFDKHWTAAGHAVAAEAIARELRTSGLSAAPAPAAQGAQGR
ncbi:MAG: SGNH/GDSL hydrolase family protein [Chloroflexota bacterium]